MDRLDVLVVGAGFSGLYLLHRLREAGFSARAIEEADDVGGTWYWNRYPGARCDVESLDYCYAFSDELQRDWQWKERYSAQPDILAYLQHVADRFDLRRDVIFGTRVTRADWDEKAGRWIVETDRGGRFEATFFIMATGCLSVPKAPEIPGIDRYRGAVYHTGRWPKEGVDFTGIDVAVIGTGSSGIQSIPQIARQAKHVTVFQRTPNYSVPAWNGPLDPEAERYAKSHIPERREALRWSDSGYLIEHNPEPIDDKPADEIERELERRWRQGGFNMLHVYDEILKDRKTNEIVADFIRAKIRERVKDPRVAEKLCPSNHPFGTKRPCVDIDYFETFNRDNVELVDIRETPIETFTGAGLRTSIREFSFDAVVFATGFDAMTGALLAVDITGCDGQTLREKWSRGPRTYLGLMVAGFPNMFMITGPGSPSVLSNMATSIEQHVEWVTDCLSHLRDRQMTRIEASEAAEEAWVARVNEEGDRTLYPEANSWYVGANVPGKPRVFMPFVGGVNTYRKLCDEIVANGYEGFETGR